MTGISPSHPRPRPHPRAWAQQTVALLVATCVTLLALTAGAAASANPPTATVSGAALHHAIVVGNADRHIFTRDTATLSACLRLHPTRCAAERHATHRARVRLTLAEQRVRTLSVHISRHRRKSSGAPTPTGTGTQTQALAAPVLAVSGQTLRWNAVSGVGSYVFVRKVPDHADEYSVVSGNSITPPAVPATTVHFSIRTNVSSSAWAPEVPISYPAAVLVAPPETPPSETPSDSGGSTSAAAFEMGVVAGSALTYERPFIRKLGAHTARVEYEIGTPTSQMAPTIEAYARTGIKPLLLASFHATLPTVAQAQNLASWAAAFGPGGTLWQGKSFPAGTAVTDIEFGNETSYAYQYADTSKASNWYAFSSYASRAQTYALRFKDAQMAIQASNSKVGLLAQADDGDSGSSAWVENMFAAVPDLAQRVAGWTVHPYGPNWQVKIDKVVSSTAAQGAPNTIPIYVTEWGLATDNGRCLSDNYGWNTCMTYGEASTALSSTVSDMKARYGTRLAAFYLYQAHDQAPTGTSTDRESYFGALQSNEAPKSTFTTTVQSLLTANP
jgi:hypothetical protein